MITRQHHTINLELKQHTRRRDFTQGPTTIKSLTRTLEFCKTNIPYNGIRIGLQWLYYSRHAYTIGLHTGNRSYYITKMMNFKTYRAYCILFKDFDPYIADPDPVIVKLARWALKTYYKTKKLQRRIL